VDEGSRSFSQVLSALSGFAFSLSLIVAIGAQNSFLLRQGLRREHVGLVVTICAASDVALIAAGVAGMGALIRSVPHLLTTVEIAGAIFLFSYGLLALRRALRPSALTAGDAGATSVRAVVLTTLALTYLNPGVYLDTVILLGSVANSHGDAWAFAAGAAIASVAWFVTVGYGARLLSPVFAKPIAWRVLDLVIAAIMVAIAVRLVLLI
jgi:L-lysine exporter family protein LysE/ArgO